MGQLCTGSIRILEHRGWSCVFVWVVRSEDRYYYRSVAQSERESLGVWYFSSFQMEITLKHLYFNLCLSPQPQNIKNKWISWCMLKTKGFKKRFLMFCGWLCFPVSMSRWAVAAEALWLRAGFQQHNEMSRKQQQYTDEHQLPVRENHGERDQNHHIKGNMSPFIQTETKIEPLPLSLSFHFTQRPLNQSNEERFLSLEQTTSEIKLTVWCIYAAMRGRDTKNESPHCSSESNLSGTVVSEDVWRVGWAERVISSWVFCFCRSELRLDLQFTHSGEMKLNWTLKKLMFNVYKKIWGVNGRSAPISLSRNALWLKSCLINQPFFVV